MVSIFLFTPGSTAVSYTHLDVYKRQQLEDVRAELKRMDSQQGDVEQDSAEHQSEIAQRQNELNEHREALGKLRDKVT